MQRHKSMTRRGAFLKQGLLSFALVVLLLALLAPLLLVQWQPPAQLSQPGVLPSVRDETNPQPRLGGEGLGVILSDALAAGTAHSNGGASQRLTLGNAALAAVLPAAIQLLAPNQGWSAGFTLADGAAELILSIPVWNLPQARIEPRLNISFTLIDTPGPALPRPQTLSVGYLPIPQRVADWASEKMLARIFQQRQDTLLDVRAEFERAFTGLAFTPQSAAVEFAWESAALDRLSWELQRGLVSQAALEASAEYTERLHLLLEALPATKRAVSLSELLPTLAQLALARSLNGAEPQEENVALLFALSTHLAASAALIDSPHTAAELERAPEIRLSRRQDLAQHVINSAAIAATAGPEIAEMISTGKEAFDARYRSGFSFSDLTANRVGITLARLATGNTATALEFQRRLARLSSDAELIPPVGNNRDGLSQAEFEAQYRDRASATYRERTQAIEREVGQLPLFAGLAL